MYTLSLFLSCTGLIVLTLGLFSSAVEENVILSKPICAVSFGILIGPSILNLFPVEAALNDANILKEAFGLVIAISVMGVALHLPPSFFKKNWKSMASILFIVMPGMWLFSALIALVFLDIRWSFALILGAIITPTDPVLSTTVVQGKLAKKNLPDRIRYTLFAESGANDGLAYILVIFSYYLLESNTNSILKLVGFDVLVVDILGAVLVGFVFGGATAKLLKYSEEKDEIEKHSLLVITLALTLFVYGTCEVLKINGIIGVFVAGLTFSNIATTKERLEEERIQESINHLFTIFIFAVFGMAIPWEAWSKLDISSIVFVIAILVLRRIPALFLFGNLIPTMKTKKELLFAGWFGPIGIAALFYAKLIDSKSSGQIDLWPLVALVVFGSVFLHGMTESFFTKRLGNSYEK